MLLQQRGGLRVGAVISIIRVISTTPFTLDISIEPWMMQAWAPVVPARRPAR